MAEQHESRDRASPRLQAFVMSLEDRDEAFLDIVDEAILDAPDPEHFPVENIAVSQIRALRRYYEGSEYKSSAIAKYLIELPQRHLHWEGASRGILNLYCRTYWGRSNEWNFRVKKVQRAAEELIRHATAACPLIISSGGDRALYGLRDRIQIADDLLDHLPTSTNDVGSRISLVRELDDNLSAMEEITRRQGPAASVNQDQLDLFKSEIRLRRTARAANFTTEQDDPSGGSSVQEDAAASQVAVQIDWYPTTLGSVLILIFTSATFSIKGWQYSPHTTGSTSDFDFWFLTQSSLVQLAALLPVIVPLLTKRKSAGHVQRQVRWWTWVFAGSSAVCLALAPILYVNVATEYSCLVAFAGAVAQTFVVLEAMLAMGAEGKRKSN